MSKNEVFTSVVLPSGNNATIYEGNGRNFFNAMRNAQGDPYHLTKFIIAEIVKINGMAISGNDVDELSLRDLAYLSTVIDTMISNNVLDGLK